MSHIATSLRTGLVLLLVSGCSSDHPISPAALPESVTVSSGLTPEISWSPGGAVYSVTVTAAGSGPLLWSAFGQLHGNAISPAVGYGTTPPGAISTANIVLPLVAGTLYKVELGRIDADGEVHLAGSSTFRP